MKISSLVNKVQPSLTVEFDGMVKAKISEDLKLGITDLAKRTVALAAGEPDFAPTVAATSAMHKALDTPGSNRYTNVKGVEPLLVAICEWINETRGLSYGLKEVISSCGAKADVYYGCLTKLERGDKVLIPSPYWTSYPEIVRSCSSRSYLPRSSLMSLPFLSLTN